jgi:hypothetical protein
MGERMAVRPRNGAKKPGTAEKGINFGATVYT